MRGPASMRGLALAVDCDELEATRGKARLVRGAVTNAVIDHEQHARFAAVVAWVDQDGTLLELGSVRFDDQVGGSQHQRMARVQKFGSRPAGDSYQVLFEANALVFFKHRSTARADDPISFTNGGGYMANLVAAGFAGA